MQILKYRLNQEHKELEIWGRAQRKAARRRKSDWGTVKKLKFSSQQSHIARTQLHCHMHV